MLKVKNNLVTLASRAKHMENLRKREIFLVQPTRLKSELDKECKGFLTFRKVFRTGSVTLANTEHFTYDSLAEFLTDPIDHFPTLLAQIVKMFYRESLTLYQVQLGDVSKIEVKADNLNAE